VSAPPRAAAPRPASPAVPPNLSARATPPVANPQPLGAGPPAPERPAAGNEDLGRVVTQEDTGSPTGETKDFSASFKAALQQIALEPEDAIPPDTEDEDWAFDDEDDLDSDDEAAKLRRQRLLQRAMQSMGALGTPPPADGVAASRAQAPLSAEEQLARSIEQRHADVLARRDHFTLLGVNQDVSRDQVKVAFLGLAKRFHPDRLPQSLAHLSPKVTTVFEAIRDAYEVLYDDARRATYLQELRTRASQQGGSQPVGDPNELFKMGEILFRKRDFSAAAEHFERAFSIQPRAVYLAARAWAIYMDPQRKPEAPKARQMMAEAIKMDPDCDRAHYQLGVIARVEEDMDRAERHFREAVRANPKHLEASQELRLIDMRKRSPTQKKGGIFR
jgi:curved DNA-binding protein CbpA